MIRVLGIDQGYGLGWSVKSPDMEPPLSGELVLTAAGPSKAEGANLQKVYSLVCRLCEKHGVTHIVREGLFVAKRESNPNTVLPRAYLTGVIELAAADLGLACTYARVDEWRKEFYGFSRAPKGIRLRSSDWFKAKAFNECDRRGWNTTSHNTAEANGIAHYGCCTLDPAYQAEARARWPHRRRK